jgi:protein-L-isoaspartate(D-aspartate) O-methyltransferase
MTDFARARTTMVDTQLRTSDVTDRRILGVMGRVPREQFVPAAWQDLAYIDEEIPLGVGNPPRHMSAPAPFARLVQLADISETDEVLLLGCGTGYSAAVLGGLAAHVVAVEPDATLAAQAKTNLAAVGASNVDVRTGTIEGGGSAKGPFDVIFLEAVVPDVPKGLLGQLKDHGRLVAIIGSGMTAVAHVFVRSGRDIAGRADFNARLPALPEPQREDTFVF